MLETIPREEGISTQSQKMLLTGTGCIAKISATFIWHQYNIVWEFVFFLQANTVYTYCVYLYLQKIHLLDLSPVYTHTQMSSCYNLITVKFEHLQHLFVIILLEKSSFA